MPKIGSLKKNNSFYKKKCIQYINLYYILYYIRYKSIKSIRHVLSNKSDPLSIKCYIIKQIRNITQTLLKKCIKIILFSPIFDLVKL